MLHKLKTFLTFPARLKLVLLHSIILIAMVRLMLIVVPFKKIRRRFQKYSGSTRLNYLRPGYSPSEIVWGVKLASKYLLRKKPCLVQALVLHSMFQRRGHPSTLRIGIRKNGSKDLQAHAWVESNGKIAIGWIPEMGDFTPFPKLRFEKSSKDQLL